MLDEIFSEISRIVNVVEHAHKTQSEQFVSTRFVCFVFLFGEVVREQTTTDVNIEKEMRESWCACVCAPYFFLFCVIFIKIVKYCIIKSN